MAFTKKTPLEGNLNEVWLPQIFVKIMMMNLTGILILELDDRTSEVYFRKGHVVHIKSNHPEDRFGQYLVRLGLLQENEVEKTLADQKTNANLKFGDLLIKNQLIERNQLLTYLTEHQSERLYYLFEHKKGSYRYVKNSQWREEISIFEVPTHRIYFEAIERFYSLEEIKSYVDLTEDSFVLRNLTHRLDFLLPPQPSKVLHSIQQAIQVKALIQKVGLPRQKVFPILFVFIIANWIEMVTDQKATKKVHSQKTIDPVMLKKVEMEYPQFLSKNYFDLFGVALQYNSQKVQTAFLQLMAKYKPFEGTPKGDEILRWIKIGYAVLMNPKMKVEYVRRLKTFEGNQQRRVDDRIYLYALICLYQGQTEQALDRFEEVHQLYPTDPLYKCYYLALVYQKDPSKDNLKICFDYFEEQLAIVRSSSYLTYIYADLLRQNKDARKAETLLADILEKDPNFMMAQKILDQIRFDRAKKAKEKTDASKKPESKLKKLLFTKIGSSEEHSPFEAEDGDEEE